MFQESGLTSVLIPSTITTIGLIIIIFIVFYFMIIRNSGILSMHKPNQCCVNEWPLGIGGTDVSTIWIEECFDPVNNYVYRFDYYNFYCIIIIMTIRKFCILSMLFPNEC
jgi:hypothetical protein